MKNIGQSLIYLLMLVFMASSCLSDHPKDTGDGEDEYAPPSEAPDLTQFVGSQIDFDVNWDDFDATTVEETETVVTDATSDEYGDFVENADFPNVVHIVYSETKAATDNKVSGVSITADGGHVVVNSTTSGVEYVLSGATTDGSLKVYSSADVKITLNGASITSSKSAAINVQSNKAVYMVVADGTKNSLTDAATYVNTDALEDQKGCVFSEGKLIFSGSGLLSVTALNNHAICSDKYVRLRAGSNVEVVSSMSDAIHSNDRIIIAGGLFVATVEGDALDCEAGDIEIRGGRVKAAVTGAASKAIKATGNVAISGGQTLLVTQGNAYYNATDSDIKSAAGIRCTGSTEIKNAQLHILSEGTAGKGINCDGSLMVENSIVKVKVTGQTYAYNSSTTSSAKAITADGSITIKSGTVWAMALGGDGCEGLESKNTLAINGGEVMVAASDNGINATLAIAINGGKVYSFSAENDALDSNGSFVLNDGIAVLSGAAYPESGIDCDQNSFKITGGTLLAIGGDTSLPTQSSQPVVIYKGNMDEGKLLTFTDMQSNMVASYVVPRNYQPMTMVFTSPNLSLNSQYNIYADGVYTGGDAFGGLVLDGSYTPGELVAQFTASAITNVTPTEAE